MPTRNSWPRILDHARAIVESYDTGVTLRQLFYRLVADGTLPNVQSRYRNLAAYTAAARRNGTFPDLLDRISRIEDGGLTFTGVEDAHQWLRYQYQRDRTEGQEWTIFLGVEKAGMSEQLSAWFSEPLGIPHVALGGFASQSLCDTVARDIERRGRPAVLIYAGDFDPSGVSMDLDFMRRVDAFDKVIRVALNEDQVEEYGLVQNPDTQTREKVERDPRAAGFIEQYGEVVQFEVDALPPGSLRYLYQSAIDGFWNPDAYDAVIELEDAEREEL